MQNAARQSTRRTEPQFPRGINGYNDRSLNRSEPCDAWRGESAIITIEDAYAENRRFGRVILKDGLIVKTDLEDDDRTDIFPSLKLWGDADGFDLSVSFFNSADGLTNVECDWSIPWEKIPDDDGVSAEFLRRYKDEALEIAAAIRLAPLATLRISAQELVVRVDDITLRAPLPETVRQKYLTTKEERERLWA